MSLKKMLAVVAAASLVAVAAPAFAANPFSDVPMNHWAYDAVEQLSARASWKVTRTARSRATAP